MLAEEFSFISAEAKDPNKVLLISQFYHFVTTNSDKRGVCEFDSVGLEK